MGGERAILRVLLVRHGLSEDNQNAIWAGHRDSSLTSIGVKQAKALGQALANFSFVAIYTSDLERARATAEEILSANRSTPTPPLVQTQSLREQNFGQAEGKSWSDGEYAYASASKSSDARTFRFTDGESLDDVNARMGVSLRRYVLPRVEALRTGADRGEPQIVIVSHGIAIAEMLKVLMAMHEDHDGSSPWPNPALNYKRVRLENTGWTLVELAMPVNENDTTYSANTSSTENGAAVTVRKSTYVRIVQQNITDHLKGALLPQTSLSQSEENQVGQMLSGATPGQSTATTIGVVPDKSSPSLALLNLRTVNSYDARQLMRELERAGASSSMLSKFGSGGDAVGAGLQAMAGGMTAPDGLQNSSTASSAAIASAPGAWSEVWQTICVQVLPVFKREQPKATIESINTKVSEHIRRSLEKSPARALESLSRDLYAFCAAGMISLNQRLEAWSNDEVRLLEGYVDVWKSFHWRILPWVEACFLPLQIDPTLISLSRRGEDNPKSTLRTEPIDIWRAALTVFRDQLIIPRFEKLFSLFLRMHEIELIHLALLANDATKTRSNDDVDEPGGDSEESKMLSPRLSQMVNIIHGVLSNDDNQAAMESLERALRVGQERTATGGVGTTQASLNATPSSRGAKRAQARQGWLPKSSAKHGATAAESSEQNAEDSTSALGKERAFLSALRSPVHDGNAELADEEQSHSGLHSDEDDEQIDVFSALRYPGGDDTQVSQSQTEIADDSYATDSTRDASGDGSGVAPPSMPGNETFGVAS